ncbi:MAG: rRNA maturation RNase YbeY [Kiritimatiellae bacterium]|nr:rRNA maturation RNase YbeY [Kiritimatiellia bacterium]MDD5521947.1 rRNA maturation RNase YbeY [Kiritimatiellia bacterium]
MKIEINNRQKICNPNITKIKKLIKELMRRANELSPDTKWGEISVALVDDNCIKALKTHFFERQEITDVISLRYNPIPGDKACLTGEIFVNIQRAIKYPQKTSSRWNASNELALYLAHGCDHLMNSSDHDETGYRRMRRRELGWLKQRSIAVLTKNLFKTVQTNQQAT